MYKSLVSFLSCVSGHQPRITPGRWGVLVVVMVCLALSSITHAADTAAEATGSSTKSSTKSSTNDIYLFIGQSNMAGRITPGREDKISKTRVLVLNDKDELVAMPGARRFNEYSTIRKSAARMGPAYFIVNRLLEARPDRTVCVVANARGGSSIRQWAKGTRYFDEAVRRTREAMKHGTLRGILWHQGETDHRMADGKYLPELVQFVHDLREALGTPDVPFIAGQITRNTKGTDIVNAQIAQLPEKVPHCAVATSEDLVTVDVWHFDRKSIELLGNRYADLLIAMLEADQKAP